MLRFHEDFDATGRGCGVEIGQVFCRCADEKAVVDHTFFRGTLEFVIKGGLGYGQWVGVGHLQKGRNSTARTGMTRRSQIFFMF